MAAWRQGPALADEGRRRHRQGAACHPPVLRGSTRAPIWFRVGASSGSVAETRSRSCITPRSGALTPVELGCDGRGGRPGCDRPSISHSTRSRRTAASARPRWLTRAFSSSESSANVRPSGGRKNTGS